MQTAIRLSRGTLNYHLAGLLDTIDSLYQKYNVLIDENEYSIKYDIPHAHMFVIEGIEKVKDVIEKNRKRKLTKHKKLSNNTIIQIDNCSPLEIVKLYFSWCNHILSPHFSHLLLTLSLFSPNSVQSNLSFTY